MMRTVPVMALVLVTGLMLCLPVHMDATTVAPSERLGNAESTSNTVVEIMSALPPGEWTEMHPASAPSPRFTNWMAYDSVSDKVILFGGRFEYFGCYNDTWAYDFDADTWTNMNPPVAPSSRFAHAMAYDSQSNRVILFGGSNELQQFSDTWAFNYERNEWTNMNPIVAPSPRADFGMVYDSQSDRVILFGGYAGYDLDETWSYDFETNSWTNMNPASRPPARFTPAIAYNIQSDRVLIFGGIGGGLRDDMWAYDFESNTWTEMHPAVKPPPSYGARFSYDSHADRVVMFGGDDPNPPYYRNDTWTYDFDADIWTKIDVYPRPFGRSYQGMAYDSRSARSIIFGGAEGNPTVLFNDTWAFSLNSPPVAIFTISPSTGTILTTFSFNASLSYDNQDPSSSLEVRWDWDDDGTWDTVRSTTKTATYQYSVPGIYTVRMEVNDTDGMMNQTTRPVIVVNTAPTASFTVAPSSGNITQTFSFDASSSSDLEDAVDLLEVRWDWENDGTWDTAWSTTKTGGHQYSSIGSYTIEMEIRDTVGLMNDTTMSVSVVNTAPAALFTVTPSSGNITQVFQVDASASSDVEDASDSLEVRWDWNDDGTWDTGWYSTKTMTHQYSAPGIYSIRVEIRDTDGLTNQTTRAVTVVNTAPIASFSVTPDSGSILQSFAVDASTSSDLEDSISVLDVRWDWENDGTWDTGWTTTKTAVHQYASNGVKSVRLAVRDTGDLESTTLRTLTVVEAPPVTTVTLAGTIGTHNWYVTSVTLNLSAMDDVSGVNETKYRLNGGSWHGYMGNVVLSNDGTTLIEYYSTDFGGYEETVKSVTVKIDKTNPTLTINQTSGFEATVDHVIISWIGSDTTSGIDRFEVSIDGGAFTSVGMAMSHNFQGLADGTHNVTVKAIDAAGNKITQTIEFTVDTSEAGGGTSGDLMLYGGIVAIIVVVIAIAIALVMRKKKVEPPAPPAN